MKLLIFNAIAYIISFFLYQKKKREVDVGTFIYAIFALSAISSVWYYSHDNMHLYYPNITFPPFLFLWLMITICLLPMSKSNFKKLKSIDDQGLGGFLDLLSVYLIIFSIFPLISLLSKFSIFSLVGDTLGEMYESDIDKSSYYFSGISKISFALIRRFGDLAVILFFYQIIKRNKWLIIGLLISNAFFILFSLVSGSRGGMLATLFVFVALGLFLKNCFHRSIYSKLKKMAIFCSSIIGIMIAMISISRFNYSISVMSSTATLDRWISQYIGEGFIRFNDDLWHINGSMRGSQNFYYLKTLLGNKYISDYPNEMYKYESLLEVPVNVFYTFIGDFYLDFGVIGTFIFVIIFAMIFTVLLKCKNGKIKISQLILLTICFHMLSFGFAANIYRTVYIQRDTMILVILAVLLYIIQKFNKYIIKKHKSYSIQNN